MMEEEEEGGGPMAASAVYPNVYYNIKATNQNQPLRTHPTITPSLNLLQSPFFKVHYPIPLFQCIHCMQLHKSMWVENGSLQFEKI
jgi:hypothetical protein